jgi:hypothetical protein
MDPEAELKTLRLRFDNFRRDFKVRRQATLLSTPILCSSPAVKVASRLSAAVFRMIFLSQFSQPAMAAGTVGDHS